MVKLELEKSQRALSQRVMRGCFIYVEGSTIKTLEPMEDTLARTDDRGFVRVKSVGGANYLVNTAHITHFTERMILELLVDDTKWNEIQGHGCGYFPNGEGHYEYFDLGATNEFEIKNCASTGHTGVTLSATPSHCGRDYCRIHKTPSFTLNID